MSDLKTLYVSRKVLNGEVLLDWAKQEGFKNLLDPSELHVTIAFSKKAVDWDQFEPRKTKLYMNILRSEVKPLGGEGAVVVKFNSNILSKRWKEFVDGGCSWDFDGYQAHVSFTYDGTDIDTTKVKQFKGELEFGHEIFKEVDLNWKAKAKREE